MGVITLKDLFEKKDISELKALMIACGQKKLRIKKKDKLIDLCIEAVCTEEVFEEHILFLPKESWNFYKKVAESANGLFCYADPIEYLISEKLGYLYVEEHDDKCYFVVPQEIQVMYDKLEESGFVYFKECCDLINDYAEAAVNLYGIISEEELVEIFNVQNEDETTLEINRAVFTKHLQYGTDYCLWNNYLVHRDLQDNDFEDAKGLLKDASDKMRYIPEKEEFLRYSDWFYYENTRQMSELSQYLINQCGVSNDYIDDIMFDLHWEFSDFFSIPNYFEILERYGVDVEEEHTDKLIELMVECCNNTRVWAYKGHTPKEYVRLSRMPKIKEPKIGRNEPCPCGSGKKYKKCCGR